MKKSISLLALCALCLLPLSAKIPPGYYNAADGLKKADLKRAMHEIIRSASVLSYGSGEGATWRGFYQTARMAHNQVRDRYSNGVFYFPSSGTSAASGMNIEHAFPKSWWGGSTTQAYKDIHHLMPCETKINSSKSNYCMGVVTSVSTDNGCTRVGSGTGSGGSTIKLWEPADKWKGDFARVYFYMATCYQDYTWTNKEGLNTLENNEWPTLRSWATDLFLQWCEDDPVDDIERARNDAVYALQGNRNPFIDFPSLGEYIWGDSTSYAFSITGSTPDTPTPDVPAQPEVLLYATFATGLDGFTAVTAAGAASQIWSHSTQYKCALANAYSLGKKGDDWLVSPTIDLTDYATARFEFEHAAGYHKGNALDHLFQVMVSEDYAGVPDEATWTVIEPEYPGPPYGSFTDFKSSGVQSLAAFAGKRITIAFRYLANSSECYAWEVNNVKVTGEPLPTSIDRNFVSPVTDDEAVFTLGGTYVGREVPKGRPGIYVVRRGGYTYKVVNR